MIILIRHAQSEGNKNREIHQMVPDHRVKLTSEGHRQAREAGRNLRSLLRPDDTLHFFTSPYRRTRETTEGILESLSSDSPSASPFPRHTIQVYEEPRLREQDFGNFQPCSAEMERMWLERADYGHFFYRIPNGESAADAYDRVSGFNESLWRLFGEDDFASVCVLVTHGLMTRVFLMKWYHWSVEYFEDLRNINHCEFVVMKLRENGKYGLDNQLRTWSELQKEKDQEKQRDRAAKGLNPGPSSDLTIPVRRKWGGCPDGCNHQIRRTGSKRSIRPLDSRREDTTKKHEPTQDHHASVKVPEPGVGDKADPPAPLPPPSSSSTAQQPSNQPSTSPEKYISFRTFGKETAQSTPIVSDTSSPTLNSSKPGSGSAFPKRPLLPHFHRDSEDHLLHPPRSTYALAKLSGRDGGGTLSGANSVAASEDERDDTPSSSSRRILPALNLEKPSQDLEHDGDDEASGTRKKPRRTKSNKHRGNGNGNGNENENDLPPPSTSANGTADSDRNAEKEKQGGNQPNGYTRDDTGDDEIEIRRRFDQSIRGSVY